MTLKNRTIIFIVVLAALVIIIALYGVQTGTYVQSKSNDTSIKTIGLSDAVNVTGSDLINLSKALQLFFIGLGVLVLIGVVVYIVFALYFKKNRDNDYP